MSIIATEQAQGDNIYKYISVLIRSSDNWRSQNCRQWHCSTCI